MKENKELQNKAEELNDEELDRVAGGVKPLIQVEDPLEPVQKQPGTRMPSVGVVTPSPRPGNPGVQKTRKL